MKRVVRVTFDLEVDVPEGMKISGKVFEHNKTYGKQAENFMKLCFSNPILAHIVVAQSQSSRMVSVIAGRKTKEFVETVKRFRNGFKQKPNTQGHENQIAE